MGETAHHKRVVVVGAGFGGLNAAKRLSGHGLDILLVEAFPYLPTTARDFVKRYVDAGKLGRKSGEGFYSDYK